MAKAYSKLVRFAIPVTGSQSTTLVTDGKFAERGRNRTLNLPRSDNTKQDAERAKCILNRFSAISPARQLAKNQNNSSTGRNRPPAFFREI
jgi:hypothetical protein